MNKNNNNIYLFLVLFLFFVQSVYGKAENYGNVTVSKIVSVYDADTFRRNIDGWEAIIGKNIPIRANGIDTPEIKCSVRKKGEDECKRLKQLARTARRLTENILKSAKVVELRNIKRGKYFRILADVFADGRSLADILIKNGVAKKYDGGKKPVW